MLKRIPKKKSTRSSNPKAYFWLVPFTLHRPRTGQDGIFQMVGEAPTPDEAVPRAPVEVAETTSLFKEPVILYFDGLLG